MRSILVTCLWLCVVLGAVSAGAERLRVGYIPIADCMQLYVAQEQGYFTAEGLEVEATPMQGGPVITMAVASGSLDVGWSNTVSLFQARERGFDVLLLAAGALEDAGEHRTHALLAVEGADIRGAAGLAGKRVAVNSLGNVNELAVELLVREAGGDPAAVRLVEVAFPEMEAALRGGSADAALMTEPFVSAAFGRGGLRELVAAPHAVFGEPFMIAGWFASGELASRRPSAGAAFRRAVDRASAWITAHPEEARAVLPRHTRLTRELAESIRIPGFAPEADLPALQRVLDLTARGGLLSAPYDAASLLAPGLR